MMCLLRVTMIQYIFLHSTNSYHGKFIKKKYNAANFVSEVLQKFKDIKYQSAKVFKLL